MNANLNIDANNPTIKLTTSEEELFQILLESVKYSGKETILRVAGGWVRDKLLGKESQDIDIALNDQSGLEFANNVNSYLSSRGLETRTIAVIQANPEQSKHLETANLRVLGFEIDCVNLRAETYTDTRIPVIRIGTAEEDALRRDFTINALFYNINEQKIEDFTGRGLEDLAKGIICTPISPFVTFRDDPLRVLRAIRFSARYNYQLDAELILAGQNKDIHTQLELKVSRERVYKECELMMTHQLSRPSLAFALMQKLQLIDVILPVHSLFEKYSIKYQTSYRVEESSESLSGFSVPALVVSQSYPSIMPAQYQLLEDWLAFGLLTERYVHLLMYLQTITSDEGSTQRQRSLSALIDILQHKVENDMLYIDAGRLQEHCFDTVSESSQLHGLNTVKLLCWSAIVAGLIECAVEEKKKEVSFLSILFRDALKMDTASMKNIQTIVDGARGFFHLRRDPSMFTIDNIAQLLRNSKDLWRESILLALAVSLTHAHLRSAGVKSLKRRSSSMDDESLFTEMILTPEQINEIYEYARMEKHILEELKLDNIWTLKPLMDGSELCKRLGIAKGPVVGRVMEEQIRWQIRTRSTDLDECISYLQERLPKL